MNFWLANNETYYRYGKKAVVPICGLGYEDMAFCRDYLALQKDLQGRGLSSQQQVFEEEAVSWSNGARFIRNSSAQFAELIMKKFLEFWSPIPNAVTKGAAHGGSARTLISVVSYTPILLLALWGVFLSIAQWRKLTPIYTYFLAFTAPYCVFLPTTRYRLPLDFFLIVFAAVALAHWWERSGRALVVRPRA